MIRILYPGKVQPVLTPAMTPETVTESRWHQPWSEPSVKTRPGLPPGDYQFLAFVKATPFPETVTESRWHLPWSEPVRLGGLATHQQQALAFTALATPAVPTMDWGSQLSLPQRQLLGLPVQEQQFLAYSESAQFPETVTESRWHEPWSEPSVKTKPGLAPQYQQFIAYSESAQFAETVTESRWHQPWSDPVRVVGLGAHQQQAFFYSPLVTTVPTMDWGSQFSLPQRQLLGLPANQQQFIAQSESAQFAETVTESRWHQPWSDPPKTATTLAHLKFRSFFPTFAAGLPESDWHQPWSEPQRRLQGLPPHLQQFLAQSESAQFAETVTESRWHLPWAEPIRTVSLGAHQQQALAFTALVTTTTPTMDWGSQFSLPQRQLLGLPTNQQQFLAYSESAQFTETVHEANWHQGWADPIQITTKWTTADNSVGFIAVQQQQVLESQWHVPWSEPVRIKLSVTWQQYQAQTEAPPFTETVTESRWHQPWSEPSVKSIQGLAAALQQNFTTSPLPPVQSAPSVSAWAAPFSDPVRTPQALSAALQATIAETLVPSLVTQFVSMGYYLPFSEPVRAKPILGPGLNPSVAQVINPVLITPFVGLGWYLPLSANGRSVPSYAALLPLDAAFNPNPIPNPPAPPFTGLFAVSGGGFDDRFAFTGLSYPDSAFSRRTE